LNKQNETFLFRPSYFVPALPCVENQEDTFYWIFMWETSRRGLKALVGQRWMWYMNLSGNKFVACWRKVEDEMKKIWKEKCLKKNILLRLFNKVLFGSFAFGRLLNRGFDDLLNVLSCELTSFTSCVLNSLAKKIKNFF
jgi:hypothetical protein